MLTIRLTGQVTPEGKLVFEVPENLPPGDVQITIEIPDAETTDKADFTEHELRDLLTFTPKPGAEVVAAGLIGGWEHKGITNPVQWVEEQRRKQQQQ
jgi:hypothetical protein